MNLLHLSDIHFGRNNPAYGLKDPFQQRDQILDELIELVSRFDEELRPEHIVFTGDIAWMGKPDEFQEAARWFQRLLDTCGLTGKDLSFCVGNHDIDLSFAYGRTDLTSDQIHEIDELYRYENIGVFEPYLSAYNDFCHALGVEPYAYPCNGESAYSYSIGYKDITFSNQKKIRLVAMNSSLLMTQPAVPHDQMWLGQEQIRSLAQYGILPADSSIWYTIGLFHHSDRYLHPNELNTYDGRSATLPILLKYTDLLLCGHSESCGRSRISHQPGGGSMLCGGAAYYSDTHINSFSMVYISDSKRTMAYIPYVYENGWVDYDFYRQDLHIPERRTLPQEGTSYENAYLLFHSENEKLRIPFTSIFLKEVSEKDDIPFSLSSKKDLMNCCQISCTKGNASNTLVLSVSLNQAQCHRVTCLRQYLKYLLFFRENGSARCTLYSSDGEPLATFDEFYFEDPPEFGATGYTAELLEDLYQLEIFYDTRFSLPARITEEERDRIKRLKNTIKKEKYIDRN